MKKINSKQTGNSIMSAFQSAVAIGLVVLWMAIVVVVWTIGLSTYTIILIMSLCAGIIVAVFFKCVLNKTNFDDITTKQQYRLRKYRGETSIYMFALPLKLLKKHIPIEHVHAGGLIEYTKKQYGVVFRYDPPSVTKRELDGFHKQMEYIANSLGSGVEASFHFYDMIDHSNPLADALLRSINTEGKTLEQKKHLHGMYEEATKNEKPFVTTSFLFAIKLGKFDSTELAMVSYNSMVPGIIKAMRERGIYAIQLVGENEIAIEFKQFAMMEKHK